MTDWVKLDPLQLGEWLAPLRSTKERGEWVTGLQSGALGALLRLGATDAEAAGHSAGLSLLAAKAADKAAASELQRARANARWGKRATADTEAMPRHESGINPAIPREEKRGEENSPQGGNGAPLPEWKAAKVEGLRRQIADHQANINRLSIMPPERRSPAAREKLEAAQAAVRQLETEILNLGVALTPAKPTTDRN